MMKFMQLVVAGLVLSANVYWELTPNPYVAAGMAIGACLAVTACIVKIQDLLCILRDPQRFPRRFGGQ